jgi:EmrB/QacA subfamily drug resistance transporter
VHAVFTLGTRPGSANRALLALLCLAQFLLVLDVTIVNVALPSIQHDLGFARESVHWVISTYAVAFGGTLLLGGRAADILGSRRMFLAGIALFTASSLFCSLAGDPAMLLAWRCVQGLGAALTAPSALALIAVAFPEGRERNRALGVWGSTAAFAAAAGVFLGGLLTELLTWEWIFLVNVPVGLMTVLLASRLVPADRPGTKRMFDLPGAALGTAGLGALTYAFTLAGERGWSDTLPLALIAAAIAVMAAFVVWERRAPDPLLPLAALRRPTHAGANIVGFIQGGVMLAVFLLLTFAMQELLGLSAIETGAGLLASRAPSILWAKLASRLSNRLGAARAACIGLGLFAAAISLFARVPAEGSYLADVLPGLILLGAAISFVFVPISIAALEGVPTDAAGVASGLLTASMWVGGALGIAIASAVALPGGAADTLDPIALATKLQGGFWAIAGASALGLVVMLVLSRRARGVEAVSREPRRAS